MDETGSEGQKLHVFFHMCNIDLTHMQQYYETLVTLKGGHTAGVVKLVTWLGLIYSPYNNEYRNLKLRKLSKESD
jgi:hypothetical protein